MLPRTPLVQDEVQSRLAFGSGHRREKVKNGVHLTVHQMGVYHDKTLGSYQRMRSL